ncbi:hypothetical protein [Nostoc sp.]|uniref:hypothetical protein n=1 Tax=Nostoc sp. TaxID=1180 RepID=UPI003FA533AD
MLIVARYWVRQVLQPPSIPIHIDDPVGAFAVHSINGMISTFFVGFLGQAELTLNKKAGLFLGGGFDLFGIQLLGVVAIAVLIIAFSFLMFGSLKALKRLRVDPKADHISIDAYEHGASVWSNVYAIKQFVEEDKNRTKTPGVSAINRE